MRLVLTVRNVWIVFAIEAWNCNKSRGWWSYDVEHDYAITARDLPDEGARSANAMAVRCMGDLYRESVKIAWGCTFYSKLVPPLKLIQVRAKLGPRNQSSFTAPSRMASSIALMPWRHQGKTSTWNLTVFWALERCISRLKLLYLFTLNDLMQYMWVRGMIAGNLVSPWSEVQIQCIIVVVIRRARKAISYPDDIIASVPMRHRK